tara:strand:+ start:592 stop:1374 length:783 start_codon:yes stop_codon:yes gene_type:complete
MKIAIGINIFGSFKRQDLCIESILKLKGMFSTTIELYNIQPKENTIHHDDFNTLYYERTSKDVMSDGTQDKPLVKSLFDTLGEVDCDYFLFSNSDIIISDRFINTIITNTGRDAFAASRMDITEIDDLQDNIVAERYQVTGFDAFAIKREWWKVNSHIFPDYIYAEPEWDVMYAVICKQNGDTMLVNKWEPSIFHVKHDIAWGDITPERTYNEYLSKVIYTDNYDRWHNYMRSVLLQRQPPNKLFIPFSNEEELEDRILS